MEQLNTNDNLNRNSMSSTSRNDDMFTPVGLDKLNYIKVVGVGGGGGNAVNHMMEEGIQGVDFVLCNTDYQALVKSAVPIKIHLGKRELGAGNDPAVGRQAAEESRDDISNLFDEKTKMLFVTAGMGGGTGTGAAPVVAQIAREKGVLTVGIVTIPFECEGRRRKQQALAGIEELKKNVDTLIVISSDKLRDEYGNMKLTEAFKKADDVLTTAAKGIAEIITVTGYVNVDFEDVKTVMQNSGKAIMGTGHASGEGRARKAIESAIISPLLNDSDIKGAKNVLLYITSGTDEVSLDEVVEMTEYTQEICGNMSDVIWGNGVDESLGDAISVTLIATGFEGEGSTIWNRTPRAIVNNETACRNGGVEKPATELERGNGTKIVHSLDETAETPETKPEIPTPCVEPVVEETDIAVELVVETTIEPEPEPIQGETKQDNTEEPTHIIHSLDEQEENSFFTVENETPKPEQNIKTTSPSSTNEENPDQGLKKFDNPFRQDDDDESFEISSKHNGNFRAETKTSRETEVITVEKPKNETDPKEELKKQRLRALSLNFRTQKGIEELENQPAYLRRDVDIEEKDQDDLSHYSSSKKGISSENPFLHDNVD